MIESRPVSTGKTGSPLDWITEELASLDRDGLRRQRRVVEPLPEGRCRIDSRTLWNFAGNDYLGLAADPRIVEASRNAAAEFGSGARASAAVSGRTPIHAELERRLAEWKHAEGAILFPSGYAANLGTIPALAGEGDVILCDRLNHASLVDGCRLSRARLRVYSHDDLDVLDRELTKAADARHRVIVTDSVFSMDGDLAPLAEIHRLAARHRALVIVDEAHATGVYGPRGTGLVPELGLAEAGFVCIGTLSKALGSQGGFVAGPRDLCEWLWNRARTQMYSTALTPAAAAAADQAIQVLTENESIAAAVRSSAVRLRHALQDRGYTVAGQGDCPIVPVLVGDIARTMDLARALEAAGYLVGAIRPPTVPRGTSRLRITVSAAHPPEALDGLYAVLSNASP